MLNRTYDLINIEKLIEEGQLGEASRLLKSTERLDSLTPLSQVRCQQLRCRIHLDLGEYETCLKLTNSLLEQSQNLGEFQCIFDTLIIMIRINYRLGRFDECNNLIEQAEKILLNQSKEQLNDLTNQKAALMGQKAAIYEQKGNLDQALDFYLQSLELWQIIEKKYEIAKVCQGLASICQKKGKIDLALEYVQKSLQIWEEIQNKQNIARCLATEAIIFSQKGDLDRALKNFELSLALNKEIGNKKDISVSLNNLGVTYYFKGNLNKALEYYLQSLPLTKEIGNKRNISLILNNLGDIYTQKGELRNAIKFLQDALDLKKEIGNKADIATTLTNLGIVYSYKGELKKALKYLEGSLRLKKEVGNNQEITITLLNSGSLYYLEGDLDRSQQYYSQALTLAEQLGSNFLIADALCGLIHVTIEQTNLDKAQQYFQHLEEINKQENSKGIDQQYRIAKALILKTDTRTRNKLKAQEIFEEIAFEEPSQYLLTLSASLNFCSLLIYELKISGNQEILKQLKDLVFKLNDIANKQQSFQLLTETCWLKAKLALIDLKLEEAVSLLLQARMIADKNGLKRLSVELLKEQQNLSSQITFWNELRQKNTSIEQRVKHTQLDKLIAQMIKNQRDYTMEAREPLQPIFLSSLLDKSSFDSLIHTPARLAILTFLYKEKLATFNILLKNTFLTRGNQLSHLKRLEEAGYIEVTKKFVNAKPQTVYQLAERGQKAFSDYLERLKTLVNSLT